MPDFASTPAPRAATAPSRPVTPGSRIDVGDIAVRLFHDHGYDATSATEIAHAAGLSRSTFFRHFHSKDDVIFADHEDLLHSISLFFQDPHPDPWSAVCDAAIMVFDRFHERLDIVRLRDLVLRDSEVLRDRETVMVSRYEKIFAAYLRREQPEYGALRAIRFAAAITAAHNYELRRLIRAQASFDSGVLVAELTEIRRLLGPSNSEQSHVEGGEESDIVVAVFSSSASPARIVRVITDTLGTM